MLTWHFEATFSDAALYFLKNWELEKENFYILMPKALLLYQDAELILEHKSKKELIEELATYLSFFQIKKL